GADVSPGSYDEHTYDAIYLAALAIEAGGKAEGTSIRDHLAAVSTAGTTYGPGDFAKAVADLHASKDINYDGASGNVDFDSSGDVKAPYDIWKVQGGAITVVESAVNP